MKLVSKALLIWALSFAPFQAQADVTIRGYSSCGKWVEARQNKRSMFNEAWVVGFISGVSAGFGADILKGTDNQSLFLWLDNYCKKNPLSDVADGSRGLILELAKKNNIKM